MSLAMETLGWDVASPAGGTMCVRVPGTQQAVNKVRVTPTQALLEGGVVAQGTGQTIFPPGLHHARGSQDPWLQVSPRRSHRVSGLAAPSIPFNVSLWKRCPNENSEHLMWPQAYLSSFGVPVYSPTPPAPGPSLLASHCALASSMDGMSFPAMFGSNGWLMGKER